MAEQVIGYLCDDGGKYKYKYYFEGTGEKIASFIANNSAKYQRIIVTDRVDEFLISLENYELYMAEGIDEWLIMAFMKSIHKGNKPLKFKQIGNYMEEVV